MILVCTNDAPSVVSILDQNILEGELLTIDLNATDVDGDTEFSHHGVWVSRDFDHNAIQDKKYFKRVDECFYINGLLAIEVKHSDVHGGCFGKRGGLFMSIPNGKK